MWEAKAKALDATKLEHEAHTATFMAELTAKWEAEVAALEALQRTHADVLTQHDEKTIVATELQVALAALAAEKDLWVQKYHELDAHQAKQEEEWTARVLEVTHKWEAEAATAQTLALQFKGRELAEAAKHEDKAAEVHGALAREKEEWATKYHTLHASQKTREAAYAAQEESWNQTVADLTSRWEAAVAKLQDAQRACDDMEARLVQDQAAGSTADPTTSSTTTTLVESSQFWTPIIHVACLVGGIAFGMKIYSN
ncbi:Aste57867_18018 [Aphanomyces stellatus]|uniref:Aste57867_18018 protein n=1 Tax=Aphanomyces stellatus TaxID=120398 RepID=A0A485L9B1_9STRA|nr:hypothetical protein As57867_017956 [Aphanomyces stellatus]VFT94757.1 Aste57867_18018 [Aphanomyces stellatus]